MTKSLPNPAIDIQQLADWHSPVLFEQRTRNAFDALNDSENSWLHFLIAYLSWNERFTKGSLALAAAISSTHSMFLEMAAPSIFAERGHTIAAMVYPTLTNETKGPRYLSQATAMGCIKFFDAEPFDLKLPGWLIHFNQNNVYNGYLGNLLKIELDVPNEVENPNEIIHRIFQGLGYHLGSEFFLPSTFSLLDEQLKNSFPELITFLKTFIANGAGSEGQPVWADHNVNQTHTEQALQCVNNALSFIPEGIVSDCKRSVHRGFLRFVLDHEFFHHRAGHVIE